MKKLVEEDDCTCDACPLCASRDMRRLGRSTVLVYAALVEYLEALAPFDGNATTLRQCNAHIRIGRDEQVEQLAVRFAEIVGAKWNLRE